MNRTLKQYRVEVLTKKSHGRHGKHMYFPLALYGFNLSDAKEVALENIAGMTFSEFKQYCSYKDENNMFLDWILNENKNHTGIIGFKLAQKYFSFKAYPDLWLD